MDTIYSLEGSLVLELGTNYKKGVLKNKRAEAIETIKRLSKLPDDAKPKWYLENDIDLRGEGEFLSESK